MASVAYTYDDLAVRQDLLDVLTNLSPTDTQLVSGLATASATNILHEWLVDTLSAVKSNAYVEGVDASFPTLTNPSRLFNYTQIFRQGYQVSDTERAVNTAAFNDRFAYEGTKALRMLKNDMEYAVMRGSLACGTGSAARQMQGIKNFLTLVTAQSGVSMSESILNDYFQNVWTATSTEVSAVYGGMYIKRKISGFTGTANYKQIEVKDRRLINAVDVYSADAAKMVKLFAHRHVTTAADITAKLNYDVVGLAEDYWRIAYLRKPFTREIPRTGDATKGECLTECTLEALNTTAGFLASQHL